MVQRSDEKLCLQWNDFQENLTSAFRDLRDEKEFTDVTLACEDGQQVEAHKVVLISSSPFFKNLLQRNKHPHPLIYMRGVKSEVLVAMVDFLYHGEANVFQENLDSFLAIAEELQLKGLHGSQTETVPDENISQTVPPKPEARTYNGTVLEETADGAGFKAHSKKIKSRGNFNKEANPETAVAQLNSSTAFTDTAELDEKVKSMMLVSENPAPGSQRQGKARICEVCGKEGGYQAIINHIEANHISGISLPCNICGTIVASRNALAQHKIRLHKQ